MVLQYSDSNITGLHIVAINLNSRCIEFNGVLYRFSSNTKYHKRNSTISCDSVIQKSKILTNAVVHIDVRNGALTNDADLKTICA